MSGERRFYVYVWTNTVNGKQYVGKGCGRRAYAHLNRDTALGAALRKYGKACFLLSFAANGLTEHEAFQEEIRLIALYGSTDPKRGYNRTHGGEGGAKSEAARARMSAAKKGRKLSEATKTKMSLVRKGRKRPEHGDKLRGRPQPPGAIQRALATKAAKTQERLKAAMEAYDGRIGVQRYARQQKISSLLLTLRLKEHGWVHTRAPVNGRLWHPPPGPEKPPAILWM